jgi:hypothetical protein
MKRMILEKSDADVLGSEHAINFRLRRKLEPARQELA